MKIKGSSLALGCPETIQDLNFWGARRSCNVDKINKVNTNNLDINQPKGPPETIQIINNPLTLPALRFRLFLSETKWNRPHG